MADATAQAREQVKKAAEAKAEAVKEAHAHQGRPTPTQEENDLHAAGVPIETHEDDGSGPSPEYRMVVTRTAEAGKPGTYQTRGVEAAPAPAQPKR